MRACVRACMGGCVSPRRTSLETTLERPELQHLLVEETIPRPVASVLAGSACCPGAQEAGSHPAGGTRGEKRRSLAGGPGGCEAPKWHPRDVVAETRSGCSKCLGPSRPLLPSERPHPPLLPAPGTAVFQSAFLGVGGGGGRHMEGVGFREAQREEAVK